VLTLDELFELLVKPEIADAFALKAPLKAARKDEQLEALREQHGEPRPFSQLVCRAADDRVRDPASSPCATACA
jgi:hypothetical protein